METTDEINSLVSANVLDTKNRIEQPVLKNTHIKTCDCTRRLRCRRRELQPVPLAIEIHAPVSTPRRLRVRILSDRKLRSDLIEKLFFREPVQIVNCTGSRKKSFSMR